MGIVAPLFPFYSSIKEAYSVPRSSCGFLRISVDFALQAISHSIMFCHYRQKTTGPVFEHGRCGFVELVLYLQATFMLLCRVSQMFEDCVYFIKDRGTGKRECGFLKVMEHDRSMR